MTKNEKIWRLLMDGIGNQYGVAAVMGNMMAESSMNPLSMTGGKAREYDADEYAMLADLGEISVDEFSHDGIAFGLVQWLFWSRKRDLLKYCMAHELPVGNVASQVEYVLQEMPKYHEVWNAVVNAVNIQEPCDMVMLKYEKPGNTSEAMKNRRRKYAEYFYEAYANTYNPHDEETKEKEAEIHAKANELKSILTWLKEHGYTYDVASGQIIPTDGEDDSQ